MLAGGAPGDALSFGVVRSLALAAMALTAVLSIVVALYLGNYAGKTLTRKNHNFASLLADNLNNQIYRRFTLPTVSIFGRIALRNPEQYKQLDLIIQSIIQGLNVEDVRIYSDDHTIAYSTNPEELGSQDLAGPSVDRAAEADGPIFDMVETIPYWQAFSASPWSPRPFACAPPIPCALKTGRAHLRLTGRSWASWSSPRT